MPKEPRLLGALLVLDEMEDVAVYGACGAVVRKGDPGGTRDAE